jgi:hypothetical protein
MAFPYLYSASFDVGDNSEWDSEADSGSLLDFPHYVTLARTPGLAMPYRGAYCMRIQPGDTNDHTVIEGDIDIADDVTRWIRFALHISDDFATSSDDIFNIWEFQQAGGTVEGCISLQITAATDLVEIGAADGTEAASGFTEITKGVWHVIEAKYTVSTGGSGVFDLYIDGVRRQNLTSLTNAAAIGKGALGTQNTLAATSTGYLLFDEFAFDDTRIGITDRFETNQLVTTSSFLFMGPGRIDNIKLLDGGSGDVTVELYDTDIFTSSLTPRWRERTAANNTNVDAADVPITFVRGCLAIIGGTLPGVIFNIGRAVGWGSDGAIRNYAARRKPSIVTGGS